MTHSPTGRRAVAYVRTSTSDTHSPEAQTASILQWADKSGLYILKWFKEGEDRNPRGTSHTRAKFQALLAEIREGRWDVLVVASGDRLGRTDSLEHARFLELLRSNGCTLCVVDEGHDQAKPPAAPTGSRVAYYMRVGTAEQLTTPAQTKSNRKED